MRVVGSSPTWGATKVAFSILCLRASPVPRSNSALVSGISDLSDFAFSDALAPTRGRRRANPPRHVRKRGRGNPGVGYLNAPARGACRYHYLCPFGDQVARRRNRHETLHVGSKANDRARVKAVGP